MNALPSIVPQIDKQGCSPPLDGVPMPLYVPFTVKETLTHSLTHSLTQPLSFPWLCPGRNVDATLGEWRTPMAKFCPFVSPRLEDGPPEAAFPRGHHDGGHGLLFGCLEKDPIVE